MTSPSNPRILPGDDSDEAIIGRAREILQAEERAIAEAGRRLGPAFAAAVRLILACRGRVCLTGMGKAGLIGQKIQATLASTGTLAYNLHPVEALHGDIGMVHPDDVVIALSKSGSSELVQLLPRMKEVGCRVILITANPSSKAGRHADLVLDFGDTGEACPLRLAPSSSTAAMLALGDALALTVMALKDVKPEQYARYHPGGELGRYLMKAREVMRTGPNAPSVQESATLGDCYEAIRQAPRRAGAAAVVDAQGLLVGILTHGDFFRLFRQPEVTAASPVASVMTRNPKRISAEDRVVDGIPVMTRHGIDDLPVVDEQGRFLGLIDIQDLIERGFNLSENQ